MCMCIISSLTWWHTDWLERWEFFFFFFFYCTAEARHTTLVCSSHSVAMENINTDGFRGSPWSHSAHICATCLTLCVWSPMIPLHLSTYRLSIIRGSRVLRHWQRFFSFTLYAQLHAVLLNGLCLFHISFLFLHKHSRYWMNGDRSALCSVPPSRRRIKTPQLTFNIQFKKKL